MINYWERMSDRDIFYMYMKFFTAFLILFFGGWLACTGLLVTDAPASDTQDLSFFKVLFQEWRKNTSIAFCVLPLGVLLFPGVYFLNKRQASASKTIGLVVLGVICSILFYALIPGSFYYLYPPQQRVTDPAKSIDLLFKTILPYPGNLLAVLPTSILACVASSMCVTQAFGKKMLVLLGALIMTVPALHVAKVPALAYLKGPPEPTDIEQEGSEECCAAAYKELLLHGYLATSGMIAVVIQTEEICQSKCTAISDCMDACEQQKKVCRADNEDGICRKNYDLCLFNCPQPPSSVLIK